MVADLTGAVEIFSFTVAGSFAAFILTGSKEQLLPDGSPEQENVTGATSEPSVPKASVNLAASPHATVACAGETLRVSLSEGGGGGAGATWSPTLKSIELENAAPALSFAVTVRR